jgi:hypothetical protein
MVLSPDKTEGSGYKPEPAGRKTKKIAGSASFLLKLNQA